MTVKKSLGIITVVLGLTHSAFGDIKSKTTTELTNQAELHLIDGDYKAALDIYNSVLNQPGNSVFAQDLYNALICALKANASETADRYAMLLAKKGVGNVFFEKNSKLRELRRHATWKTLIDEARNAKANYEISNNAIRETINKLLIEVNKVDSAFYVSDLTEVRILRRDVTVDSISEVLLQLILQNGYPSEDMIPVLITDDTIINAMPRFAQIITKRSIRVNPATDSLFKIVLMREGVKKGLLKPEIYLEMTRNSLKFDDVLYSRFFQFDGCIVYKTKLVSERNVDYFRSSIGACSLNDYLKKVLYNIQFPNADFSINSFYSRLEPKQNIPDFDHLYQKVAAIAECK